MTEIERLLGIMAQLRDPQTGCPWDIEQSFATIAPYTIEEAYEVADAIARNDLTELRDELGDLLLQVVFHARMAEELGEFDFNDVACSINEKMLRRHPHVFAGQDAQSTEELHQQWETLKAAERAAKAATDKSPSALDGVALGLPALTRAEKIQKRARRVGFDWQTLDPVVAKVEEELSEVLEALNSEVSDPAKVEEEMGDYLFSVVNLSRHLKIDPETALRNATLKFSKRFQQVESLAAGQEKSLEDLNMAQMDELWNLVKRSE